MTLNMTLKTMLYIHTGELINDIYNTGEKQYDIE